MARQREHGTGGQRPTQVGSNGFVNRRSTVQSRPPAHSSQNPVGDESLPCCAGAVSVRAGGLWVGYDCLVHGAEQWRPVVGLEEIYRVSSLGRVQRAETGRVLSPAVAPNGYLTVVLCFAGIPNTRKVHQLVADAFIGPRPNGATINHIDAVKLNNRHWNLEYISHAENVAHAKRMGLLTGPRSKACSKCRIPGHTALTCERRQVVSP